VGIDSLFLIHVEFCGSFLSPLFFFFSSQKRSFLLRDCLLFPALRKNWVFVLLLKKTQFHLTPFPLSLKDRKLSPFLRSLPRQGELPLLVIPTCPPFFLGRNALLSMDKGNPLPPCGASSPPLLSLSLLHAPPFPLRPGSPTSPCPRFSLGFRSRRLCYSE